MYQSCNPRYLVSVVFLISYNNYNYNNSFSESETVVRYCFSSPPATCTHFILLPESGQTCERCAGRDSVNFPDWFRTLPRLPRSDLVMVELRSGVTWHQVSGEWCDHGDHNDARWVVIGVIIMIIMMPGHYDQSAVIRNRCWREMGDPYKYYNTQLTMIITDCSIDQLLLHSQRP